MRYAYVVTTWSGAKFVETIHSIPKGSRVLTVDNSQLGWPLAKAWNYGIDRLCNREGYDVAIVCNDDIILRPDSGDLLAAKLMERPTLGDSEILLLSGRHAAPNDNRTDSADMDLLNAAEPRLQPGPDFAFFATTARLLREIGPFDERFNPCFFEDNDYHRRLQLAGFEGAAYAPFWHMLNGTIRTDPERQAVITGGAFEQCRAYYIAKWGNVPGKETFTVPFGRPA